MNEDLISHLKELIAISPALESIPAEERNLRIQNMLTSPPEKMQQIIAVLEQEQQTIAQIEEEFEQHADEVEAYLGELKGAKHKQERDERIALENSTKIQDEKAAELLLKKLDEIM